MVYSVIELREGLNNVKALEVKLGGVSLQAVLPRIPGAKCGNGQLIDSSNGTSGSSLYLRSDVETLSALLDSPGQDGAEPTMLEAWKQLTSDVIAVGGNYRDLGFLLTGVCREAMAGERGSKIRGQSLLIKGLTSMYPLWPVMRQLILHLPVSFSVCEA